MTKKDDFIVSFMISLQEYRTAKREYFISCCEEFKISDDEKNDVLRKMDLFDRAEENELLNTIQWFSEFNQFDDFKYCDDRIIVSMSSIQRKINDYVEKEQLKTLVKYNRLANWIKFKNFISKLFKMS